MLFSCHMENVWFLQLYNAIYANYIITFEYIIAKPETCMILCKVDLCCFRMARQLFYIITIHYYVCSYVLCLSAENKTFDRLPTYEDNKRLYYQNGFRLLTFTDVEELFMYKETIEFLESFEDKVHREIVRQQLLYCPYTSLCTFSFNLYFSGYDSACKPCSCEPGCIKDCCPDALNYSKWKEVNKNIPPIIEECFWTYFKWSEYYREDGYMMVYKCNVTDRQHQELCNVKHPLSHEMFFDNIPVTDTKTNLSYVSKQCALCNNASEGSLVDWKRELVCHSNDHFYNQESDITDFVLSRRDCNLKYSPVGVQANTCRPVAGNCNVTGKWKIFDEFLLDACLFYKLSYRVNSVILDFIAGSTYR